MTKQKLMPGVVLTVMTTGVSAQAADGWKPAENPLMTRWGKQLKPDNVLAEYPRPQMVRTTITGTPITKPISRAWPPCVMWCGRMWCTCAPTCPESWQITL